MKTKVRVILTSVVTYATIASAVIAGLVAELRAEDMLPDNWTGPIISIAAPVAGVLAVTAGTIKRVMPVPKDGVQVVMEDGSVQDVHRGWD